MLIDLQLDGCCVRCACVVRALVCGFGGIFARELIAVFCLIRLFGVTAVNSVVVFIFLFDWFDFV